jgi:DMSO/TMAO reductase YedYZ molybdopterin-dependent catalytic subunit
MQVLKQHKNMILSIILLVVILPMSVFIVQNVSKPSPVATPSPPPTQTPTSTGTITPTPTNQTTTTPRATPKKTIGPVPSSNPQLYPGEITQYQNQTLSQINAVYQNAIAGIRHIDQTSYRLSIDGLVNQPLRYTYDQVVHNHQSTKKVVTLNCVEGWSATILWEGIQVNDLLQEAGIKSQATVVIFHASDGYTTALPLDYIVQNHIMIAYKMNNATLTPQIGWPFMVVAQDQYGYKWAKWLMEIEVSSDTGYLGYWERQGYPNNANVGV